MTKKKLLMLLGSVCLALVLAVPLAISCTGPASTPTPTPTLTPTPTPTLTPTPAPGAEVYTGIFTNRDAVYAPYCDELVNNIRVMTNGQLDLTVVLEESIGRLEDGLLNLGQGHFQCGRMAVEYSSGIAPSLDPGGGSFTFASLCEDEGELIELEYDYAVGDVYQSMVFDKLNVTTVFPVLYTVENILSNVPIYGIDDLKGVKFRSAGAFARCLEAFDAETVWFPGSEIYTSLASGLIEAVSYECPSTMYHMGLNEVTKYWTGLPQQRPMGMNQIMANNDWWNSLPEHLQVSFEIAVKESSYRNYIWTRKMDKVALRKCEEEGIIVTPWSAEDMKLWGEMWYKVNVADLAKTDPVIAACMPHVEQFLEDNGRALPE